MKHSDDHSLFAWTAEDQDDSAMHGLLAKHPRYFQRSGDIVAYEDREDRAPFSMSNRGLCIELPLTKLAPESLYAAALDCPVPPRFEDSRFLAIYLRKLPYSHGQFARVRVGSFGEIRHQGNLETIYVRQSIVVPNIAGIFPTHLLQLRKLTTSGDGYRVARTMLHHNQDTSKDSSQPIKTTQSAREWVPAKNPIICVISNKASTGILFAIQLVFEEIESVIVLLGTINLQIEFSVVLSESLELSLRERKELFRTDFTASPAGSNIVIGYHRVRVTAEPLVSGDAKYYMIDIEVAALERPRNVIEEVMNAIEDFITPESDLPVQTRRSIMDRVKRPFGVRRIG